MNNLLRPLIFGVCLLAPSALQAHVVPASAPDGASPDKGIEDIVVTARRTSERLQDAPLSITAFSDKALEARGVVTVRDVARFTPNLAANKGPVSGTDANFFIRGIGQEDSTASRDPGVGVYLDGVYLGRTSGSALDSLDIAQIEVLRGPQGTLFGRNTIGGAINITSARPTDGWEGRLVLRGGERDLIDGRGTISGPLVDGIVGVRLSGGVRRQDGWGRRASDGRKLGNVRQYTARAQLQFKPIEGFEALLIGDYSRVRGTLGPVNSRGLNAAFLGPDPTRFNPFSIPLPPGMAADVPADPLTFASNISSDQRSELDVYGAALTLSYELSDTLTVKSITSYRKLEQFSQKDYDGTEYLFYDFEAPLDQKQFSQELQLSGQALEDKVKFLIGTYYFYEKIAQLSANYLGGPPVPFDSSGVIFHQHIFPRNRNYALFAQATLALADNWNLTAGGRYTEERKRQRYDFFIDNRSGFLPGGSMRPPFNTPFANRPFIPIPLPAQSINFNPFTWMLSTDYRFSDQILAYASASTGFRSGGFQARPTSVAQTAPYQPEKVTAYEIGLKTDLLDRSLRLNLAAFQTDYKDIQVFASPSGSFLLIQNAAKGRIRGFEAELTAALTKVFTLNAGVGYTDAEFTRLDPTVAASGLTLKSRFPNSPKWTAIVSPQLDVNLGGARGTINARADYSYQSAIVFFAGDLGRAFSQDSYELVNARIGWTSDDENISIAAYAINLFDKRYLNFASDNLSNLGVSTAEPGPPQELGVELSFRF